MIGRIDKHTNRNEYNKIDSNYKIGELKIC